MTKILLVEDDKALREIYGVRLLAEGYDIVSAGDGEEALTTAINEQPDLIISDVMMPKISGFEMLDLLRTNAKTRDIKVIVMSALGGEAQRQRGAELGADRYLVKSQVGIEDVVATVHEVLNEIKSDIQQPPMPTATQSPFNSIQSTAPNLVTGTVAPNLPDTPQSIPTVMRSEPITAPANITTPSNPFAPTLAPQVQLQDTKPLLPGNNPMAQALPPIPTPDTRPDQSTQMNAMDSLPPQPKKIENAIPRNTPTATGSARIIAPTGETLNPQVNIDNLIAKEDATSIAPNLTFAPTPNSSISPEMPINISPQPSNIQSNDDGIINLDSVPQQESSANSIFPTN